MTREPILGPGAAPFLVFAVMALAVRFWLIPMLYPEQELEFRHLAECSTTPPPPGVVFVCQSSASP